MACVPLGLLLTLLVSVLFFVSSCCESTCCTQRRVDLTEAFALRQGIVHCWPTFYVQHCSVGLNYCIFTAVSEQLPTNYICDTMHQAPTDSAFFCESEDSVCGNALY